MQGTAPDDCVRRIAQAVAVAWGETMLRSCAAAPQRDPLRVSVDDSGRMSAGFASLSRARALFQTSSRLQGIIDSAAGGGERAPLITSSRVKNVSLLGDL